MIVYFKDSMNNIWRRTGKKMWHYRAKKNYVYITSEIDNGWVFDGYHENGAMPCHGGQLKRISDEDAFAALMMEES